MFLLSRFTMENNDLCSPRNPHVHTPVALRTPLRCGLSIVVCSCLLFGAQQCLARGQQDVAGAARHERARKEQSKKTRHVYTDEDLKRNKILTPEDEERVAAERKQPAPAEQPTETSLDASAGVAELPLGDIARLYRNAKRAMQAPPFHLPFDEPVLAEPLFAAPALSAPFVPAPEIAEPVDAAISAPTVTAPRLAVAPVRPRLTPAQPHVAAAPAMSQPALRRVDPFARRVSPAEPAYMAPTSGMPSHRAIPAPPAPSVNSGAMPSAVPSAPRLNSVRSSFAAPSSAGAVPVPAIPSRTIAAPPAPSVMHSAPQPGPVAPQLKVVPPSFAPPSESVVPPIPAAPHRIIPSAPGPSVVPSTPQSAPHPPRFSTLRPTVTAPSASAAAPPPPPAG